RWRESFSVRAGVEGAVSERVRLRGGAFYDHQAAPSDTLAASGPDMSRVGLTVGGSVQLHGTRAADLSYSLAFFVPRDSTSTAAAADGAPAGGAGPGVLPLVVGGELPGKPRREELLPLAATLGLRLPSHDARERRALGRRLLFPSRLPSPLPLPLLLRRHGSRL